jgi:hypothetical protein
MAGKDEVSDHIRHAFAATEYPGDAFLVGSREGCEPEDEVGPFRGRTDRALIEPSFLDGHDCALSFFSEGAFRYFLPAYLLADLDGLLLTAEPLFHLTGGFTDISIEAEAGGRTFVRRSGRTVLLNPRRYGAMTFEDYARFRLSVFTREEARAIVAYLEYKRNTDIHRLHDATINAALDLFWRERAKSAPTSAGLAAHLADDEAYFRAIRDRQPGR